jgi:hypothetical protein
MNLDNVKRLRDFLITIPDTNFRHETWYGVTNTYPDADEELLVGGHNLCGTAACLGGWSAIVGNLIPYNVDPNGMIEFENDYAEIDFLKISGEWLGLTDDERMILFAPFDLQSYDFEDDDMWRAFLNGRAISGDTTVHEAIEFLDQMIETECVDQNWWIEIKK